MVSKKGKGDEAGSGGPGAGFLGGGTFSTFYLTSSLDLSILPQHTCFLLYNKSVCGLTPFCGRKGPMLGNPSCEELGPHLIPYCMQIHTHAPHQFACLAIKMGVLLLMSCWSAETARCREERVCVICEQVGKQISKC